MEQYKVGDISSFLNNESTSCQSDLFDKCSAKNVDVTDIYAKPELRIRTKKRKKIQKKSEAVTEDTEPKFEAMSAKEKLEIDKRTLFVGNLPIGLKMKQLRKHFDEFGTIESLRFRSCAIGDPKLGRKVCMKTNRINENGFTKNGYVVFKTEDSVTNALVKNGSVLVDRHIRVDKVCKSKSDVRDDAKHSIFLGNLPFDVNEEDVREALLQCGDIDYVRITRDKETNIGKGFGYVKFKDSAGPSLAMEVKDMIQVGGRKIRIQKCKSKATLDNIKTKKSEKAKRQITHKKCDSQGKNSFRGRKSKVTDKDLMIGKKRKRKRNDVRPTKGPKSSTNTTPKNKFNKKHRKLKRGV